MPHLVPILFPERSPMYSWIKAPSLSIGLSNRDWRPYGIVRLICAYRGSECEKPLTLTWQISIATVSAMEGSSNPVLANNCCFSNAHHR